LRAGTLRNNTGFLLFFISNKKKNLNSWKLGKHFVGKGIWQRKRNVKGEKKFIFQGFRVIEHSF
jgi:hypothetical protein